MQHSSSRDSRMKEEKRSEKSHRDRDSKRDHAAAATTASETKTSSSKEPTNGHNHSSKSSRAAEDDGDFKIHSKQDNRNGFHSKPHSNSKEDEENNSRLKDMALDVKSEEAVEQGDFKKFDLPKEIVTKLKGKKKTETNSHTHLFSRLVIHFFLFLTQKRASTICIQFRWRVSSTFAPVTMS
jgi:hypothetical protein